jgi:ribosomal protein L37E
MHFGAMHAVLHANRVGDVSRARYRRCGRSVFARQSQKKLACIFKGLERASVRAQAGGERIALVTSACGFSGLCAIKMRRA